MTDEFQHYPKMMVHPQFQPATLGTSDDDRKGIPGTRGTPIRFPPVTVNTQLQEDYHAAQGYVAGKADPAAFVAAKAAPVGAAHGHQEYPKWVGDRTVHNRQEEAEARADIARREVEEAEREKAEAERAAQDVGADDVRAEVAALKRDMGDIRSMLELLLEKAASPAPAKGPRKVRGADSEAASEQDAA